MFPTRDVPGLRRPIRRTGTVRNGARLIRAFAGRPGGNESGAIEAGATR